MVVSAFMKSITVIDYGIGNIRSVLNALNHVGYTVTFTADRTLISRADRLLLPGVGAFQPAMKKLNSLGLTDLIHEHTAAGRPLLGICLGMQLLCSGSHEFGWFPGLGYFNLEVTSFTGCPKVPQMGWNTLHPVDPHHPLFRNALPGDYVYFVHSYYAPVGDGTAATTDYYGDYSSVLIKDRVVGMQFHPEKSSTTGLTLLKNFGDL